MRKLIVIAATSSLALVASGCASPGYVAAHPPQGAVVVQQHPVPPPMPVQQPVTRTETTVSVTEEECRVEVQIRGGTREAANTLNERITHEVCIAESRDPTGTERFGDANATWRRTN